MIESTYYLVWLKDKCVVEYKDLATLIGALDEITYHGLLGETLLVHVNHKGERKVMQGKTAVWSFCKAQADMLDKICKRLNLVTASAETGQL